MHFVSQWVRSHFGDPAGDIMAQIENEAVAKAKTINWYQVLTDIFNGAVAKKPIMVILAQVAADLGVTMPSVPASAPTAP